MVKGSPECLSPAEGEEGKAGGSPSQLPRSPERNVWVGSMVLLKEETYMLCEDLGRHLFVRGWGGQAGVQKRVGVVRTAATVQYALGTGLACAQPV